MFEPTLGWIFVVAKFVAAKGGRHLRSRGCEFEMVNNASPPKVAMKLFFYPPK